LTQSPRKIIEAARKRGLALIAVTDHNASENVGPTRRAGSRAGITVVAGMEVTTAEEVHVVALFDDLADLGKLQGKVYERLQAGENDPERFGYQVIVDESENVLGMNRRLLLGATDMDLETTVAYIRQYGGLAVGAHVDRPAFSCTSQLGLVPEGLFEAIEISPFADPADYASCGYPVIRCSDAHQPEDVGKGFTVFELAAPTFEEVRLALRGEDGRRIAGYSS
jgi:PHP family Zn ribbon phosphoesterase